MYNPNLHIRNFVFGGVQEVREAAGANKDGTEAIAEPTLVKFDNVAKKGKREKVRQTKKQAEGKQMSQQSHHPPMYGDVNSAAQFPGN